MVRFLRCCSETQQTAFFQLVALYCRWSTVQQLSAKNTICWISKYDFRLAGSQKTSLLAATFFLKLLSPCLFDFRGHSDAVDQLIWHPTDPDLLATASGDRTVRIWDYRSAKSVTTVNTKGENINITWSPDGKTLAVGNKEDLISFIDVKSHKIIREEQFKVCEITSKNFMFLIWSTQRDDN